ncbi:MAG: outer membrane beta-barrel protein [Flammeovirgaceae bacterium]|nr:MAG: outer membrane beta-barrel protein [Flammeovirgaceae bacterium]
MKKVLSIIALLFLVYSGETLAQEKKEMTPGEKILAEAEPKKTFDKKFRWGISWNQYWGIITGDGLPEDYFAKPCIGFNLRAEYYPLPFLGIGAGFGVQQRGAGIKNPDFYGGPFTHPWEPNYDPDSTYRERLRMNTIEIPVTVLLRTPNDVIKGVRVSGAAGVVFIKNDYVKKFFHKPEDGFHSITDVSSDYIKNDLGYQVSLGADIDAAGSCILQVHLVYTKGTKNIYKVESGDGRAETYGFRVAWLY